MNTPRVNLSEITVLRKGVYAPSERKVQNILRNINFELPRDSFFKVVEETPQEIIIQGDSLYTRSFIKKLKENHLDFIANLSGKNFEPIKLHIGEDGVDIVKESVKSGKKWKKLAETAEKVFQ